MQIIKQTFYKYDKKVVLRKLRENKEYIPFVASFVKSKYLGIKMIKSFLRYVITDIKELNFIKNDVAFLMHELFGTNGRYSESDFTTSLSYPFKLGTIIYIWTYLPYEYDLTTYDTPDDIRQTIFPFDLFFTRLNLTDKQCKYIQNKLYKEVDVKIYCRKLNEIPNLPCTIYADK